MNKCKRVLTMLLTIVLLGGLLPVGVVEVQAAEVKVVDPLNDVILLDVYLDKDKQLDSGNIDVAKLNWEYVLELPEVNITPLYWAPAGGTNHNHDYIVVGVNRDTGEFYVCRVDNSSVDDAADLPGEGQISSICKLNGTDRKYLQWLRPKQGSDTKENYVRGSYQVNGGKKNTYYLDYKAAYTDRVSQYDNMFDILNTDKLENNQASRMCIEGTLRSLGDVVHSDFTDLVDPAKNIKNQEWFTSKVESTGSILVVKTANSFTLESRQVVGGKYEEKPLDNLAAFLSKLNNDGTDLSNYPLLKKLCADFSTLEGKLGKAQTDASNSAATATVVNVKEEDFKKLSAYAKWSLVIQNYIATKGVETKVTSDATGKYDLSAYATWIAKKANIDEDKANEKKTLCAEERLRLASYFYVARTKSGNTVNDIDGLKLPTDGFVMRPIVESGLDTSKVKQAVEEEIKLLADNGESSASLISIALNYRSVIKYLVAKAYDYKEGNPFEIEGEADQQIITDSKYLKTIVPAMDESVGVMHYAVTLPQIKNMQYVAGSEEAYTAYEQLQYMLMAAASYAEFNLVDKIGDKFTNAELDKFILDNKSNPTNADMSEDIKATIISYTQIYEAFDYLGIEPFTDKLKVVCAYYNELLNYAESSELKAYNPADLKGEPMRNFFSVESATLNYYYNLGVSLSSTYIPMQTNLYDVNSMAPLDDLEFVEKFHYPYGFYRKALFIDTNINSAVDYYVTKKKGTRRVATLNDLLEPEKDIMLYIDTNFYNVKKLAEMQGFTYNKLANTEDAGTDGTETSSVKSFVADKWTDWFDTNIESITKTGDASTYSKNVKTKIKDDYDGDSSNDKGTDYVLSDTAIDKYLKGYSDGSTSGDEEIYDEYTPLQAFAVVSAIYRHSELYSRVVDQNRKQSPVFISSPNLAGVEGTGPEQWNTIFNYLMLKNIKGNMGIDYKTTLDLDSPIYIDIYGNIVTESGLVIIPAASNSTLQKASMYTVYNAGFLDLYNNGYNLPAEYNNSDEFMKDMFEKDNETNTWVVSNKTINGLYMNFTDLPVSDMSVLKSFQELMNQNINKNCLEFDQRVWLMTEVLRGAPVESIDKDQEGLKGNRAINKYGIYFAYKIDELASQLLSNSNGNSLVTLPNLAYMEYVEYAVLFLFKLIFAVMLVLLLYKIYIDAVQGYLGMKTFITFVTTLVAFVAIAFAIPKLLDFSYYQTNKRLLQNEVQQIELLNLEKKGEGREIGVYEVSEPETQTKLYLKLDELSVPWYEVMDDVLSSNAFDTMDEVYESAFENSLMANLPGVIKKSNGLYMDVDRLFESTVIEYTADRNAIYSRTLETPYASYCLPYYAILDDLVTRVNKYNLDNDIKSYTTKVQSRGAVKTVGMIQSYFASEYFMEQSQDVLGLKYIYGLDTTLVETNVFTEEQLATMKESMWFSSGNYTEEELYAGIDKIDYQARAFVSKNRDLIGKVTDETFLKVMALSLAIEHNKEFKVPACNSIEIFDIDTRDIMRLSFAENSKVLDDSSKSFARFVYDTSGALGVTAVAFLIIIYFISSLIKPTCMFIILACVVYSLIIRRLVKRENDRAVEGFLVTMALLCGTNVIYAVFLKLSIMLPSTGLTPIVCILMQIMLQVMYFIIMVALTVFVVKDSANMGFANYEVAAHKIGTMTIAQATVAMDRLKFGGNTTAREYSQYRERNDFNKKHKTRGVTGRSVYDMMKQRDEKREHDYEER